jgi:hypothetical protein
VNSYYPHTNSEVKTATPKQCELRTVNAVKQSVATAAATTAATTAAIVDHHGLLPASSAATSAAIALSSAVASYCSAAHVAVISASMCLRIAGVSNSCASPQMFMLIAPS